MTKELLEVYKIKEGWIGQTGVIIPDITFDQLQNIEQMFDGI